LQMTYLGYCGGAGISAMDYRFSDPYLDDATTEGDYTEKTVYLPEVYWSYCVVGEAPEVAEPPMRRNGFVTFGCLNKFAKVSLPAQRLWGRILRETENSRLVLHSQEGDHLIELKDRFEEWGIARDRIEFVPRQSRGEYMRSYGRLDIALDPFPFGGGITTCDALWMGVPVVSLVGKLSVGRAGKSILSNVGLSDLVAKDEEEYVSIAKRLGGDVERLEELRKNMRGKMRQSPLMNGRKFTRDMEMIYRQVWRKWCAGA
jgi:protein O-GlcNAc transferase